MLIGAQGYTVRTFMQNETDIARSLAKIAKIGYKAIQISAIGPIAPQKLRAMCDDNGMEIALTHTPEPRLLSDLDNVIREHEVLGCKTIGLGGMAERYRNPDWIEYFIEDFLPVTEKIVAAGMTFSYHNHNFEFETMRDGRKIIDVIVGGFPAKNLAFTLDTYWLQAGGVSVVEWIGKLRGRVPCVHLKDMALSGMAQRMAPVGEGNLTFPEILKAFEASGARYAFVEQDDCYGESPFDCLKKSFDYLARLGYC